MPIRINLKELFSIDSQDITVDKLNFNFNKLLELGVGQEGPIGPTGPEGSAGPIGLTGDTGKRGSLWFIDSFTDPNGNITTGLFNNDLYIGSNDFTIWQYSESTDSWSQKGDIGQVVQSYLTQFGETFVRGTNERFILFANRGNTVADVTNDSGLGEGGNNLSDNDVLYLNNFNEDFDTTILTEIDDELANALAKITVDNRTSNKGRYHLELGSLIGDSTSSETSTLKHNFKLRYYQDGKLSSDPVNVANVNLERGNGGVIPTALFSLDIPENSPIGNRDFNSLFDFRLPKYYSNTDPLLEANEELHIKYGSIHALSSDISDEVEFLGDGIRINVKNTITNYDINLGIWRNSEIGNLPKVSGVNYLSNDKSQDNYFILGGGDTIKGIFLNKDVFQDGGNIVQVGSKSPNEIKAKEYIIEGSTTGTVPYTSLGNIAIASNGSTIYTLGGVTMNGVSLNTAKGYFNSFSIDNPLNPTSLNSLIFTSQTVPSGSGTCPNYALGVNNPIGGGITDIAIMGNYGFAVNNIDLSTSNIGNSHRTYFQILKLESDSLGRLKPERISRLGFETDTTDERDLNIGILAAHRIKLDNNFAIISTNALELGSSTTNLGRPGDFDNLSLSKWYTGTIAKLDISELSGYPTINYANPVYISNPTQINGTNCSKAIMDLEVYESDIYTVTWEQTLSANAKVNIGIQIYDSNLNIVAKSNTAIWENYSLTNPVYQNLSKKASIAVDSRSIYVGYVDTITIYDSRFERCSGISSVIEKANLPISNEYLGPSTNSEILDIKLVGSNLYVLCTRLVDQSPSSIQVSSIIKIDVSDPTNPVQVWEYILTDGDSLIGSKFIVEGKHIWVAIHSNSDNPLNPEGGLVLVDYDGIYTAGAHIDSLLTDQIHVNKNITVNQDIEVNRNANIGNNLTVFGNQVNSGTFTTVGDSLFKSNVKILGDLNINDLVTVDSSTGNINVGPDNVFINGNGSIYMTNWLNINDQFRVSQIDGSVYIGSTPTKVTIDGATGNIYTLGLINVNAGKFTVDSVTGNVFTSGDLNVNNNFTVDSATGDIFTAGDLNVNTNCIVYSNGDIFTVGDLNIDNNCTIDSGTGDIFTVGDIFTEGNLNVNEAFKVDGLNGATQIGGGGTWIRNQIIGSFAFEYNSSGIGFNLLSNSSNIFEIVPTYDIGSSFAGSRGYIRLTVTLTDPVLSDYPYIGRNNIIASHENGYFIGNEEVLFNARHISVTAISATEMEFLIYMDATPAGARTYSITFIATTVLND